MRRIHSPHGFTVIELLVVCAVVAVLAAILLPVLSHVRERGRQAACLSNQRQLAVLIHLYAQDHEDYLPSTTAALGIFSANPKLQVCPSLPKATSAYGYNSAVSGRVLGSLTDPRIILTADVHPTFPGQAAAGAPTSTYGFRTSASAAADSSVRSGRLITSEKDLARRHNRRLIASFLDGHVRLLTPSDPLVLTPAVEEEATPVSPEATPVSPDTTPVSPDEDEDEDEDDEDAGADAIAPTLVPPAAITRPRTAAGTPVALGSPQVSDDLDPAPQVTNNAPSTFPLGTTQVTWEAVDAAGNRTTAVQQVTITDTQAPVVSSVRASTTTLWPPNHQMVPVTVTVVATDNGPVPVSRIIGVTSNEPENGLGDGDTDSDWSFSAPLTVQLRAERSAQGSGRTYTLTVQTDDDAGNSTTRTLAVSVPRNQGNNR
jgi:prepilin-type N-terminal cleavage/methylation domain-containing protein/prepilin-type processing-associated H-X9-DG protein